MKELFSGADPQAGLRRESPASRKQPRSLRRAGPGVTSSASAADTYGSRYFSQRTPRYVGRWEPGRIYDVRLAVRHAGSVWASRRATLDEPGNGDAWERLGASYGADRIAPGGQAGAQAGQGGRQPPQGVPGWA